MFELGTDGPSAILVGVDGTETSLRAASYAAGLARRQGARLIALFVHTMSGLVATVPAAVGATMQMNEAIVADLRSEIGKNGPRLGIDITLVEATGNPYVEIVRVADEMRVDAVVIGASTQAGHRLVGSLALRLVRDARWPVTVVP
jgi:nucleotide-binding universal stress UspA family protein